MEGSREDAYLIPVSACACWSESTRRRRFAGRIKSSCLGRGSAADGSYESFAKIIALLCLPLCLHFFFGSARPRPWKRFGPHLLQAGTVGTVSAAPSARISSIGRRRPRQQRHEGCRLRIRRYRRLLASQARRSPATSSPTRKVSLPALSPRRLRPFQGPEIGIYSMPARKPAPAAPAAAP